MQYVLPDQVTLGYILRSCNPRPWDGSDQYLVRTVSFEIPFLDFCSNFVQMFSRVLATRINNKTYGLDNHKPQRRSGPLFRMQSDRTVSRRNLIIKWSRFSYFLNPHFIPNKLIGSFNLPSYWKVNLKSSSGTAEQVRLVSVTPAGLHCSEPVRHTSSHCFSNNKT